MTHFHLAKLAKDSLPFLLAFLPLLSLYIFVNSVTLFLLIKLLGFSFDSSLSFLTSNLLLNLAAFTIRILQGFILSVSQLLNC